MYSISASEFLKTQAEILLADEIESQHYELAYLTEIGQLALSVTTTPNDNNPLHVIRFALTDGSNDDQPYLDATFDSIEAFEAHPVTACGDRSLDENGFFGLSVIEKIIENFDDHATDHERAIFRKIAQYSHIIMDGTTGKYENGLNNLNTAIPLAEVIFNVTTAFSPVIELGKSSTLYRADGTYVSIDQRHYVEHCATLDLEDTVLLNIQSTTPENTYDLAFYTHCGKVLTETGDIYSPAESAPIGCEEIVLERLSSALIDIALNKQGIIP